MGQNQLVWPPEYISFLLAHMGIECSSQKHTNIILTPLLYSKTGVYRGRHYFSHHENIPI